jgi:predicted aldo/keto reductase-like oxidoreductase
MRYRRFGRTELQMPVFSCGGMRYQQSWDDIDPEKVEEAGQRNLEATILRALQLGINHIETARGYGSSEMQLGWILPKLPREKMIVQTKIAPFATAKEFRKTFEKSMKYLRLEYVDLLSLHGINQAELLDWSLRKGGSLDEARAIQREGPVPFHRFQHARHHGHHRARDRQRWIRLRESPLVLRESLQLECRRSCRSARHGCVHHQPERQGGKLYAPPEKLRKLCTPAQPDSVQRPLLPRQAAGAHA